MAELGFNPEEYQNDEFTPIPAGKYRVFVDQATITDLKNYAGKGVRVQFKVMEGACQKRVLSSLYSIYHTDQEKQKMARQMFARLCRAACGTANIRNTDELLGRQLIAEVEVNGDYNNVKRVHPIQGGELRVESGVTGGGNEGQRPELRTGGMSEKRSNDDAGSVVPAAKPAPAKKWNSDECPF